MRILDKYLTKEFVYALLGCLATFTLLYIVIDLLGTLQDIIKNHVSFIVLRNYYLSLLPVVFTQTSPIAILLATLYSLGKLSHHNEIIAMRSSGLSITQIITPIVVISLIISCATLLINEKILPRTAKIADELRNQQISKESKASRQEEIVKNVTVFGRDNRLIFIGKFKKQSKEIADVTILDQDRNQNITTKVIANNGKWLGGSKWRFLQTIIYNYNTLGNVENEPIFETEYEFDMKESPAELLSKKMKTENMNIAEITEYMQRISETNSPVVMQRLQVELQHKIAYPFTAFIITLVGIPFGFRSKRRAAAITSLGLCLGLSFSYYVVSAVGIALGVAGILYPMIAAWSAHIIFAAVGLTLLSRLP